MILHVYSIFDSASGVYDRPFFSVRDASAVRSFSDIAVAADHIIGQHPEDLSLFFIGTDDDNTGVMVSVDRVCLITALEAVSVFQVVDQPDLFAVED